MNAPNSEIRRASTVFLAALFLVSGCSRKKEAQPGPTAAKPQPVRPAMASAEKTSFQEVTSQLEPGGNLFAYFGTEQWIRGASEQVSSWRGILQVAPVLTDDQRAEANKGFDLATRLIRNSGLEEISGVGMSGIATEKGRYRTKLLVHHYPDRKSGYLWSLFGTAPHALDGLNQLPTTTALSVFFDLDLRGLWAILQRELSASGIAGLDEWSRGFPKEFEAKTGINFEALLNSLGGEFGIVLTLDDTRKVSLPLPTPRPLEIPEPRLALVVKVKDNVLFDHLDKLLQENPQVTRVDEEGLRMRTMPLPVPVPIPLRPSIARAGDYFYFGSTDTVIREMLAVRDGKQPGLKSADEFKRMTSGVQEQGNSLVFVSPRFTRAISELQTAALAAAPGGPEKARVLQGLLALSPDAFVYNVSANTPDGWLTVGNGNSDPSRKALLLATVQPAAVVGLLAAIAIPNFVKARQTAQYNTIVNNLRIIEGAKAQWALENKKGEGSPASEQDLAQYLRGGKINPVAGETYHINPVGTPPTATLSQQIMNHPAGSVIKAQ
ncbi:MAG: hypothetical protein DME23_08245 [Verrucomicrobia bacterium]|nr:MAG: hypothetical protein DME23_08245 [Verrucomicrobiota bacterium]